MGGSSVMVEDMGRYLRSLERLQSLELDRLYPGHGPEIEQPQQVISWYIAHRLQREQEILDAFDRRGHRMWMRSSRRSTGRSIRSLHPLAARR